MAAFDRVHFIQGPGQHASVIVNALKSQVNEVEAFNYYPYFSRTIYKDGKQVHKLGNRKLDPVSRLIWTINHRLPVAFLRPWHLDVYYSQYEKRIRKQPEKAPGLLWTWSQDGLDSICLHKKLDLGPVVLEYPMVHPLTWRTTILNEAEKYYSHKYMRRFYSLFTTRMEHRALTEISMPDTIILLSDFAVKTFTDWGVPAHKLHKVRLPYSTEVKPRQWRQKEKVVFLYVGRLELWKGVPYLIQAFKRLQTSKAELWLAGTVFPEIEGFLKKELVPQIKVLGFQSKLQLEQLYQKADVFVFPTLQDSFGVVILEAMANGLPVIGSTHSFAPEIIDDGQNGFLYTPYNVDELTANMQKFLSNSNLISSMVEFTQNKVKSDHSTSIYNQQIGQIVNFLKGTVQLAYGN